jgi:hypothetical protein
MRRLLTAAVLALLTTTAANAGKNEVAEGFAVLTIYNENCEKLENRSVPFPMQTLADAVAKLDAATVKAGQERAMALYRDMGHAKFCATYKLGIDNAAADNRRQRAAATAAPTAHAEQSLVGAIGIAGRDYPVCQRAEDAIPANNAWQTRHITPFDTCGFIKQGKAFLVRDEKPRPDIPAMKMLCVQIYANRESADHYAQNTDPCFWTAGLFEDAYEAISGGHRVGNSADKLFEGYWRYAFVQYCHKAREGYLAVYINDPEMDRAKTAVEAIKTKALAEQPDIDTDAIWRKAVAHNNGSPVSDSWCHRIYAELLRLSPVGVITIDKP